MQKKSKARKQSLNQVTVQPEKQRRATPGVADDTSSKGTPQDRGDARTAHDKDGNEDNARSSPR
jgi:hypothetical protein